MKGDDTQKKMAHSIESASAAADVCRDKIYDAIRTGQLRAKKFGRRTLIADEDLRAFIQNLPTLELRP